MNDALVGLRRFDVPHVVEPDRANAIREALSKKRGRATSSSSPARATRPTRF